MDFIKKAKDFVEEKVEDAGGADKVADQAKDAYNQFSGREGGDQAQEAAGEVKEQGEQQAQDWGQQAQDQAGDLGEQGQQQAQDLGQQAQDQAGDMGEQGQQQAQDWQGRSEDGQQ